MSQHTQPELNLQPATARATYGDRVIDQKMVDTSRDKMDALDAEMAETQKAVLALIRQHPDGIGACQVAQMLDRSILSIRPVMTLLKRRGHIYDTGQRRHIRGGRSREALMTAEVSRADPALIGSGQLARVSEARVEALLELKEKIATKARLNTWWLGSINSGSDIINMLHQMIEDTRHE